MPIHRRLQQSLKPAVIICLREVYSHNFFAHAPSLFSVQPACGNSPEKHRFFLSSVVHPQFFGFSSHRASTSEQISLSYSCKLFKLLNSLGPQLRNSSSAAPYYRNGRTQPKGLPGPGPSQTVTNIRCQGKSLKTHSDGFPRRCSGSPVPAVTSLYIVFHSGIFFHGFFLVLFISLC